MGCKSSQPAPAPAPEPEPEPEPVALTPAERLFQKIDDGIRTRHEARETEKRKQIQAQIDANIYYLQLIPSTLITLDPPIEVRPGWWVIRLYMSEYPRGNKELPTKQVPGGGEEPVFILQVNELPNVPHSQYLEAARAKLPEFIRIVDLAPQMLVSTNRAQKTITIEPFVEPEADPDTES